MTTSTTRKLDRCKNFLTTLLSPAPPKKPTRRKTSASLHSRSFEEEKSNVKEASVQHVEIGDVTVHKSNLESTSLDIQPCSSLSPTERIEPLYATVQKKKKDPNVQIETKHGSNVESHSSENFPSIPLKQNGAEDDFTSNDSNNLSSDSDLVRDQQEKNKRMKLTEFQQNKVLKTDDELKKRMEAISEKNKELSRLVQSMKRDAKWKEETDHTKLRHEITKLETKTKKEVSMLCERIKVLDEERKLLSDHVHILHGEKQLLHKKYAEVCKEKEKMISSEQHAKAVDEQHKFLTNEKTEQLKEINRLKLLNKTSINERNSLAIQMEILQDEINSLKSQNRVLEKQCQDMQHDKDELMKQIEEFKNQENEVQLLLSSLLRVAENIEIERDVLLSKAAFQEHVHGEIQTTVVNYGLNIGRLQEHLLSIKKNYEEVEKAKIEHQNDDENLKHSYEKQLAILRGKLQNQNIVIKQLEMEKSELKCHLESSLWKQINTSSDRATFYKYLADEDKIQVMQ